MPTQASKAELAQAICAELKVVYAQTEEEIAYPAPREALKE